MPVIKIGREYAARLISGLRMFEESVEYVMKMVTPITDWIDVELLSPGEYYVDRYLPELNTDQKLKHVDDEKGSRACQLAVKFTRRVFQHAHVEQKYMRCLLYTGYEESILLMKINCDNFSRFVNHLPKNQTKNMESQLQHENIGTITVHENTNSEPTIIFT